MKREDGNVGGSGHRQQHGVPNDEAQTLGPFGRAISDRSHVGEEHDHFIMVCIVIETRNPSRVGLARVGQGEQPNEAGEQDEGKESRQVQTTPAALSRFTGGIDGLSGATNQGHRYFPTKVGRSEQWRDLAFAWSPLNEANGSRARCPDGVCLRASRAVGTPTSADTRNGSWRILNLPGRQPVDDERPRPPHNRPLVPAEGMPGRRPDTLAAQTKSWGPLVDGHKS